MAWEWGCYSKVLMSVPYTPTPPSPPSTSQSGLPRARHPSVCCHCHRSHQSWVVWARPPQSLGSMQHGNISPLANGLHQPSPVWSTPEKVTMNSSMSEYTSFTANMSEIQNTHKHKYTYHSHSSNSQCTVVQWENPLAVQYPSATLSHLHTTGVLICSSKARIVCSVGLMVC